MNIVQLARVDGGVLALCDEGTILFGTATLKIDNSPENPRQCSIVWTRVQESWEHV